MKHMYIPLLFISLVACQSSNQTTMMVNPLKALNNDGRNEIIEVNNELPSFTKPGKPITVTIPQEEMGLEEDSIIKSYTFIPLETTDESLIGEIKKLETDGEYIFILDDGHSKALQFNKNGKFIRTIGKRGRGPNEYVSIEDMSIDKTNKRICLLDNGGTKLLFYDYNGNCVKEEPQYFTCMNMEFIGNLRISYASTSRNNRIPAIELHQLIVCNEDGIPIYCDFPISEAMSSQFRWNPQHPLTNFSDGIYYSDMLSDTVWNIKPDGMKPAFVLEFPNRKPIFSAAEIANMNDELYERKMHKTISFNSEKMITDKFAYFTIADEHGSIHKILYSRKTGKTLRYSSGIFPPVKITQLGSYFSSASYDFIFQDSLFTTVLQPHNMIEKIKNSGTEIYRNLQPKDRQMLEALKVEDNPVLMLVKLKDF